METGQILKQGFPGGSVVQNLPANSGDVGVEGSIPASRSSLEEEMQPTPVFLPGESHGQKSLHLLIHLKEREYTYYMSMSIMYFYDKKNDFVSSQKEKVCDKSDFVFSLCKSL